MGKWVLRYLFSNLIDEEIRRDEEYRKTLEEKRERTRKENLQIPLPPPAFSMIDAAASPVTTPTAKNPGGGGGAGYSSFAQTPGMHIGAVTPAPQFITTPWGDDGSARKSSERQSSDYFSAGGGTYKNGVESEDAPGSPVEAKEEKGTSRFGGWRSAFGNKKLGRSVSIDMGSSKPVPVPNTADDNKPTIVETAAAASSEEDNKAELDETLGAVVRKIRAGYDTSSEDPITTVIAPSLPHETPVLKPPHSVTIIVQEDKPDFGGVADLYRGTVGSLGEDADTLERVMPAWLAELLLLNRTPLKDTIKVSFVLVPWQDELPILPSESGRYNPPSFWSRLRFVAKPPTHSEGKNSRLNANRMLRAKKILAYVAEHLAPPFMNTSYLPEVAEGEEPPKPEDWLELCCHDTVGPPYPQKKGFCVLMRNVQIVQPTMTLATIRSFVWKTGGDVVLHYRRKEKRNEKPQTAGAPGMQENVGIAR
jgi:WD repeat-containing protein 48